MCIELCSFYRLRCGARRHEARHEERVAFTQSGSATIVFLGDSITQGWESTGLATWNAQLAPLGAANFGFSGDRTEHVLWRLQNGEIVKLQPKVIVLLGKALDNGTEGDVVNVMNLQSKRTVSGVVVGRGRVAIVVASRPEEPQQPKLQDKISDSTSSLGAAPAAAAASLANAGAQALAKPE